MQPPPSTIRALKDLRYEIKVFCTTPAGARVRLDGTAPNGVAHDLEALDPDATEAELALRLRRSLCGAPGTLRKRRRPSDHVPDLGRDGFSPGPAGLGRPRPRR